MKYILDMKKMYADIVVAIVPNDPWLRLERETPLTGSGMPDCATTSPKRAYTGTRNAYIKGYRCCKGDMRYEYEHKYI